MKKESLIAAIIFALSACGGGGGESAAPKIADLEGIWRGDLVLVSDMCDLKVNPLQERHEILIDGDMVTLTATDGRILEGSAGTDSSFAVQISDGQAFPTVDSVQYDSIRDGAANVTVEHVWSRPGGCSTTWVGVMTKQ